MKVSVDIKLDGMPEETIEAAKEFGIHTVGQQALQDCNFYCKQDTSTLINSSLIHSEPQKGILRWVTPYAEFQYKYPGTRLDKNPNAGPEWCQRATENHKQEWAQIFEKAVKDYAG